ncbi:Arginyl-tRNA--protein transferase 1 [Rhizopus azygosporus]|uniref:Arginyl-tRNA--protein transferase 1 n=1 Tax=Rhizopus azygosporus TaxID=86630 RepID=A0A367JTW5_RHIAZ|nr:Arginyl-tRNA--protein transferase 1 [Rhizopus azygosporus]
MNSDDEYDLLKDHVSALVSLCGDSQHDCGYCDGKDTSKSFGIWAHFMSCSDYQALIDRGWRRSGHYLYKPDMERTCCPQYTIRLHAMDYKLTKGQKKVLNKFNRYIQGTWSPEREEQQDVKNKPKENTPKSLLDWVHAPDHTDNKYKLKLEPSSYTKEKHELYKKYQISVHHDEPEELTERKFRRFLIDSPLKMETKGDVTFGSFHQKYILDGKLIALSVIDILPSCVSAVYFMYDPDYSFLGLGKYSVFREVSLVLELKDDDLKYYYMDSCPKMNYKGQYEPSDLLDPVDYTWHPIQEFRKEFTKHKFVTFAQGIEYTTAGWLNRKEITQSVLSNVLVYIGEGRVLPAKHLLQAIKDPQIRASIIDFVCAVGLDLAYSILISF